jgi:hypothetical protein
MKSVEQNLADVAAQFATAASVVEWRQPTSPLADVQAQFDSASSLRNAVPAPATIARGTGRHVVAEPKVIVDHGYLAALKR